MRYLVTRPEPDALATAEAVVRLGHQAIVDPMLKVVYGATGTIDLFGVQGLAVTSPNGVRALSEAGASIKALPVYAVGDATAALARASGFASVTSADGDGEALVDAILTRADPAGGPILWAHGHDKAIDLADRLRRRGLQARAIEVYRAEPARALAAQTVEAFAARALDGILVFSPRTARTLIERLAGEGWLEVARTLSIHALSEKVAAPFQEAGFEVIRIATKPNAEALYRTLPQADGGSGTKLPKKARSTSRDAALRADV